MIKDMLLVTWGFGLALAMGAIENRLQSKPKTEVHATAPQAVPEYPRVILNGRQ